MTSKGGIREAMLYKNYDKGSVSVGVYNRVRDIDGG